MLASRAPRRRLYLVGTPGGHLDLLLALRPEFEPYERVWVVSEGNSAQMLRDERERVIALPRFHGFDPRNLTLAMRSLTPALRGRPGLVITSGSGNVVPFCLAARARGSKLMFIETMARVYGPSAAGKVLARAANSVLVQWPELLSAYPNAQICRPALLDFVGEGKLGAPTGSGTFVAIGTHLDPFDRLLRTVDDALERGVLPTPAVAQTGVCTYEMRNANASPWLAPGQIDTYASGARYIICHAGSGIVTRALSSGRRPLVMARLARYGEHVDDHQLQLAQKLGEFGLIVVIEDRIEPHHLEKADSLFHPTKIMPEAPEMSVLVRDEIQRLLAGPA